MTEQITTLAAADVDADIVAGTLAPHKRAARIAQRTGKFAFTITVYGIVTDEGSSAPLLNIALVYGTATDGTNYYCDPATGEPVAMTTRVLHRPSQPTDDDIAFARNALADLKSRYGPLPVRCNRFAEPIMHALELAA